MAQLHWAGSPGLFTQLLKASRQARSQEWRCDISAAEFWGSHDDMN